MNRMLKFLPATFVLVLGANAFAFENGEHINTCHDRLNRDSAYIEVEMVDAKSTYYLVVRNGNVEYRTSNLKQAKSLLSNLCVKILSQE